MQLPVFMRIRLIIVLLPQCEGKKATTGEEVANATTDRTVIIPWKIILAL